MSIAHGNGMALGSLGGRYTLHMNVFLCVLLACLVAVPTVRSWDQTYNMGQESSHGPKHRSQVEKYSFHRENPTRAPWVQSQPAEHPNDRNVRHRDRPNDSRRYSSIKLGEDIIESAIKAPEPRRIKVKWWHSTTQKNRIAKAEKGKWSVGEEPIDSVPETFLENIQSMVHSISKTPARRVCDLTPIEKKLRDLTYNELLNGKMINPLSLAYFKELNDRIMRPHSRLSPISWMTVNQCLNNSLVALNDVKRGYTRGSTLFGYRKGQSRNGIFLMDVEVPKPKRFDSAQAMVLDMQFEGGRVTVQVMMHKRENEPSSEPIQESADRSGRRTDNSEELLLPCRDSLIGTKRPNLHIRNFDTPVKDSSLNANDGGPTEAAPRKPWLRLHVVEYQLLESQWPRIRSQKFIDVPIKFGNAVSQFVLGVSINLNSRMYQIVFLDRKNPYRDVASTSRQAQQPLETLSFSGLILTGLFQPCTTPTRIIFGSSLSSSIFSRTLLPVRVFKVEFRALLELSYFIASSSSVPCLVTDETLLWEFGPSAFRQCVDALK